MCAPFDICLARDLFGKQFVAVVVVALISGGDDDARETRAIDYLNCTMPLSVQCVQLYNRRTLGNLGDISSSISACLRRLSHDLSVSCLPECVHHR